MKYTLQCEVEVGETSIVYVKRGRRHLDCMSFSFNFCGERLEIGGYHGIECYTWSTSMYGGSRLVQINDTFKINWNTEEALVLLDKFVDVIVKEVLPEKPYLRKKLVKYLLNEENLHAEYRLFVDRLLRKLPEETK